jgi:hypothetical protein
MTKSLKLALVLSGPVRRYPVTRLRNLAEHLGPVKAQSYRQASRIANALRAGYPVHEYKELARSRVVLLCAPEKKFAALAAELGSAALEWRRKVVVICGGPFDSGSLAELAARGAEIASVHCLEEAQQPRFLVEGDRLAVRYARRLIEGGGGIAIEIRRNYAGVCAAGVAFASWLLLALVDAAAVCFRQAGLAPRKAGAIVERVGQRTLRAYLKAGRRACRVLATAEERTAFHYQLESLRKAQPELAGLFLELAGLALNHLGRETAWLDEVAAARRAAGGD